MLIQLKFSNYLSFLNEQEFSLFPSKVRGFRNHVFKTESESQPNILKSALIYGANSSGKSNLVKAIRDSKNFIISNNTSNWDIPFFALIKDNNQETIFSYDLFLDNSCYQYGFLINQGLVKSEWLKILTKSYEKNLFLRTTEGEKVTVDFKLNFKDEDSKVFHTTISKGTRNNQLFLNFINNQNTSEIETIFIDIFSWFKNKLTIIRPDSKLSGVELKLLKNKDLFEFYNTCLTKLDTGIDKLSFEEFGFDDQKLQIPDFIKNEIKQKFKDKVTTCTLGNSDNEIYFIEKREDKLIAKKLKAAHAIKNGDDKLFDFSSESDGTNRIMDLIPMLYLLQQGHTVVIDEIDRSFHSLVTQKMFDLFFNSTKLLPSQLIATTHDLSLLDLKKFRRDEIWFIEKDRERESQLYSLEEFKPRFDKQLRSAYLEGRFGAIPLISDAEELTNAV